MPSYLSSLEGNIPDANRIRVPSFTSLEIFHLKEKVVLQFLGSKECQTPAWESYWEDLADAVSCPPQGQEEAFSPHLLMKHKVVPKSGDGHHPSRKPSETCLTQTTTQEAGGPEDPHGGYGHTFQRTSNGKNHWVEPFLFLRYKD